jgi:hypothetical protein
MVAGLSNRQRQQTTSELLTVNILAPVQDADDHHPVILCNMGVNFGQIGFRRFRNL